MTPVRGRGRVRVRVGMGCGLRWGEVGAEAGKGWGGGRVGLYLAAKVGVTSDIDSRRSFATGHSFPARRRSDLGEVTCSYFRFLEIKIRLVVPSSTSSLAYCSRFLRRISKIFSAGISSKYSLFIIFSCSIFAHLVEVHTFGVWAGSIIQEITM